MWSAAILAGGHARRFGGRDKAALRVGSSAILERQLALLRTVVDRILIVANDRARYAGYGVPVVCDLVSGAGAVGGLYTAIRAAGTPRTLVIACDLPFLTGAFLSRLVADGHDVDVLLPRTADGFQPLCATYSDRAGVQLGLEIQAGVRKVIDAVRGADGLVIRELGPEELAPYDRHGTLFFNVNTPDDHARAIDLEARLRSSSVVGPPDSAPGTSSGRPTSLRKRRRAAEALREGGRRLARRRPKSRAKAAGLEGNHKQKIVPHPRRVVKPRTR